MTRAHHLADDQAGDPPNATRSVVAARYSATGDRTSLERVHEAGSLRLRHPRGPACEAVLVNTAGGVVAGDRLDISVEVAPGAAVTLTSAAAEKVYRSQGAVARIATRLTLGAASRVAWVPQETILFDRARLDRRFEVELADDAALLAAEIVIFGRAASGERVVSGSLRDSWRVRRAGRLVFADETRLEGDIGATLARAAVAKGACASALLLLARPDAAGRLDPLRAAIDDACLDSSVEGGASLKDGIIVARLVAAAGEPLRRVVATVLASAGGIATPRVWQ